MTNKDAKKLILGILLISALIIAGSVIIAHFKQRSTISSPTTDSSTKSPSPSVISIPLSPLYTDRKIVTLTKTGFDPVSVTIKKGTLVQWINKSGIEGSVGSSDHPPYPPLNLNRFPNGSSLSATFDKTGTYKYSDFLHPDKTGMIIVE